LDFISAYRTNAPNTSVALAGTGTTRTFRMPAFGVTVTAAFKKTIVAEMFYIDFLTSYEGGTLEVITDIPYLAAAGETVTMILTPDPDYEVESVTVQGYDDSSIIVPVNCTGSVCTFTMPNHNVSISVSFTSPATGNGQWTIDHGQLRAYAANGVLHVSGLNVGNRWNVYNILGTLVYQGVASADKAEIALPQRGLYIVSDGKTVVKVNN